MGLDALVLDVKVGAGAFMKRQVDARRLAQMMVGIGRRMDKRVQALITDMNQPLGYAIGNALEVMEVSQTLQNAGPADLTRLSLELAARMIYLGKITATLEEAREIAQKKLLDGSGYRKLKEVIAAQGGNPQVLDRFELLPNATGAREISFAARGLRQRDRRRIHRPGVGHDRRGPRHQGRLHRSRGGRDSRSEGRPESGCGRRAVPPVLHAARSIVEEAAQLVEDAFRISGTRARRARADSRSGRARYGSMPALMETVHRPARPRGRSWRWRICFHNNRRAIQPRVILLGPRPAVRLRIPGSENSRWQSVPGAQHGRQSSARIRG